MFFTKFCYIVVIYEPILMLVRYYRFVSQP